MRDNLPIIRGFNKTSEAGFNTFAASIFLGGCNLRCPYCMNSKLVMGIVDNVVDIEGVKKFVTEEKCEWVMISGGEPTLTEESQLVNLISEIKSWGCKVGMSTNGTKREVLRQVVKLLNYVALDIKSPSGEVYERILADQGLHRMSTIHKIFISQGILAEEKIKRADFDYEIRTTLFPSFVGKKTIRGIGSLIRKQDKWVLQQFRHSKNLLNEEAFSVTPYSDKEVEKIVGIAKSFCDNVSLKSV